MVKKSTSPTTTKRETLHIYTRVSTVSQQMKGTSLTEQKEKGIERANQLGMSWKLWNEGGKSSSFEDLSNRPVLDDLLRKIEKGQVKHLFVWNTDRLSRNTTTFGMIRTTLVKHKVTLHTPTGEQQLSDDVTNMVIGILSEVAQYDNRLRTQRTRLGKLRRVRENKWMGGPSPFGFTIKDSKLAIDKTESVWVKKIFEWYSEGYSTLQIRNELVKNGITSKRGNPVWSLGSIVALLDNTHYVGRYTYKDKKEGTEVDCTCPRILSEKLFLKVQNLKQKRSYKGVGEKRTDGMVKKHSYLLTSLLRCGHCGSMYYGNVKPNTKQMSYYSCSQKSNKFRDTKVKPLCKTYRNVNIETTDEKVWGMVMDVISNSHIFKEGVKQQVFSEQKPLTNPTEKKKVLRHIESLKGDLKVIEEAIVNRQTELMILDVKSRSDPLMVGVIEKLKQKRTEVQIEVEDLQTKIDGEEQSKRWIDWLKEFRQKMDKLEKLSIDEKKRFLSGIVKEVVLTQMDKQTHNVEIHFNFPYVGDQMVYKNKTQKKGGYRLIEGEKVVKTTTNLLKKYLQTQKGDIIV